jgi:ankyrin repeat protein
MSLPSSTDDEAGFRALEPRCASPHSADSKRSVAQLSGLSQASVEVFLMKAVMWGLPNLVRCALEAGVSANYRSDCKVDRPVLVEAALRGHVFVLKELLEAGADVSLTDSQGFFALIFAAQRGHMDCIKLLLAAGADANIANAAGDTPLILSVLLKRRDCAEALLPTSDLSITNHEGFNAFHSCILSANEECFELLLPHVTDPDQRTAHGVHPSGEPLEIFNQTPLHIACQQGQHRMAKALLKRGADRNARDSMQRTPLHLAAQQGQLACVVLLLGQPRKFKMTSAEVNAVDEKGITALHVAAFHGFEKICGVLLEAGARLDLKSSEGGSPLMYARQFHPFNAPLLALLSGAGPAQPPGTVCDHCGKTAAQASVNNLKACSQCQAVRYCGAECSVAAWAGHKAACKARAAEREAATTPTVIFPPS